MPERNKVVSNAMKNKKFLSQFKTEADISKFSSFTNKFYFRPDR